MLLYPLPKKTSWGSDKCLSFTYQLHTDAHLKLCNPSGGGEEILLHNRYPMLTKETCIHDLRPTLSVHGNVSNLILLHRFNWFDR